MIKDFNNIFLDSCRGNFWECNWFVWSDCGNFTGMFSSVFRASIGYQ